MTLTSGEDVDEQKLFDSDETLSDLPTSHAVGIIVGGADVVALTCSSSRDDVAMVSVEAPIPTAAKRHDVSVSQ